MISNNLINAVSAEIDENQLDSVVRGAHCLLLLLIALPLLMLYLDVYPPIWFDEGYKTNAVRTLVERGVYGTYTTQGYIPFDPGISSGPADIVPLALSFQFFGKNVIHLRFVIVVYTLIALLSFYLIAVYLYGSESGLFVTLIMLTAPAIQGVSFLLIGRQILGEAPSLALILLGLWLWFQSWDNERWLYVSLSGLFVGLGLLSKTQVAIALIPTILLIIIGRTIVKPSQVAKSLTYLAIILAVIGSWMLLGRLATTEEIRQENSLLLMDAVRSNLLTFLWGQTLTKSAFIIIGFLSLGVLVGGWRLKGRLKELSLGTSKYWAEATLTLFVLISTFWFAFLSVGWPRYAYAGLVVSLLLIGRLGWDIFEQMQHWFQRYRLFFSNWTYSIALTCLTFIVIVVNIHPIIGFEQKNIAQQMADYISREIPRDAVIETWEWELDALSQHWEYHHPNQRYLFLAIRQFSHEQKPFNLDYDLLQADPDYLVTGPFIGPLSTILRLSN